MVRSNLHERKVLGLFSIMRQHYRATFQACTEWSCTVGKVQDNAAIMQACQLPYRGTSLATLMLNGLYGVSTPGLTSSKRTSPLQNEL